MGKQVLKLWWKLAVLMLLAGAMFAAAFHGIFSSEQWLRYTFQAGSFLVLVSAISLVAAIFCSRHKREKSSEKSDTEQMRKDFTANVSHELKTPLTSISGYAEMIENGMVKADDIPTFAGKIHAEAGRMIALIGDIIRLSELDEPNSMLETEKIDLHELALDTMELLVFHAKRRGVNLRTEGSSVTVDGSRTMLEELIYNLCDNAIRYNTPNGEVVIETGNQNGKPYLMVRDTGIGISEKHQKRIFERFYRVDKSRSRETGGTGLGLAIVKHIAEQHRATITLQSEECVGTKVRVTFSNI